MDVQSHGPNGTSYVKGLSLLSVFGQAQSSWRRFIDFLIANNQNRAWTKVPFGEFLGSYRSNYCLAEEVAYRNKRTAASR